MSAGATARAASDTRPPLTAAIVSAPTATNTSANVPNVSAVRRRGQSSQLARRWRIVRASDQSYPSSKHSGRHVSTASVSISGPCTAPAAVMPLRARGAGYARV